MPNSFILAELFTSFMWANVQLCRSKKLVWNVVPHPSRLCAELGLRTGRGIGAILSNQPAPFRPWSTGPPADAPNCR